METPSFDQLYLKGVTMTKEVTIPNWNIFGISTIAIDLFKHHSDPDTWYNAVLTLLLDDSNIEPASGPRAISLITHINGKTPVETLEELMPSLIHLFGAEIIDDCQVHDAGTGEELETLSLNAVMGEDDNTENPEDDNVLPITTKPTLH